MTLRPHRIKARESLSSIAKEYGLPGWQTLYYSNENRAFRTSNKDPDRITVGAIIQVPENKASLRVALSSRLMRLRSARTDAISLFDEQEKQLLASLAEIKSFGQQIDMAATLLTLVAGLAQMTAKAARIMKLDGKALEVANRGFAKEALGQGQGTIRDAVAKQIADSKSESADQTWLITKAVAQSWCDMTSPSFWANTIVQLIDGKSWSAAVTTSPDDVVRAAHDRLKQTRDNTLRRLDASITETEAELRSL